MASQYGRGLYIPESFYDKDYLRRAAALLRIARGTH